MSDGGWIFLFNPCDTVQSVSFSLNLSDYGIEEFSAVTNFEGFEYCPRDKMLTLHQSLSPGSYSRSRLQTGYAVSVGKISTKIEAVSWNEESKEYALSVTGAQGKHEALLTSAGQGPPIASENCEVKNYDAGTDILSISYNLPGGITGGTQGPLRLLLRWSG